MSANDIQRLQEERDAINTRLAEAKGAEKETLQRQYGERLSQLNARLEGVADKVEKKPEVAAK